VSLDTRKKCQHSWSTSCCTCHPGIQTREPRTCSCRWRLEGNKESNKVNEKIYD